MSETIDGRYGALTESICDFSSIHAWPVHNIPFCAYYRLREFTKASQTILKTIIFVCVWGLRPITLVNFYFFLHALSSRRQRGLLLWITVNRCDFTPKPHFFYLTWLWNAYVCVCVCFSACVCVWTSVRVWAQMTVATQGACQPMRLRCTLVCIDQSLKIKMLKRAKHIRNFHAKIETNENESK